MGKKSSSKTKREKSRKIEKQNEKITENKSKVKHNDDMRIIGQLSVGDYLSSPYQTGARNCNIDKKRNLRLGGPKVIVILEGTALELHCKQKFGKVKGFFLLDGMKHKYEFQNRDDGDTGEDHRPDILHHCLLNLLNSPMNRSGLLSIFIRTKNNQLIEVSSELKVPAAYDDFEAMMANLLINRKCIKGHVHQEGTGRRTLMKFLKNDLDELLPAGKEIYGLSVNGQDIEPKCLSQWVFEKFTRPTDGKLNSGEVVRPLNTPKKKPIVFIIGAVAKSDPVTKATHNEAELIRISKHSLTASQCVEKLCFAFEQAWRII